MPEIRTGLAAAAGWPSMLLRVSCRNHRKEAKGQKTDHPKPPFKPPTPSGLISNQGEPEPALENRLRRPKSFDDGQSSSNSFCFL